MPSASEVLTDARNISDFERFEFERQVLLAQAGGANIQPARAHVLRGAGFGANSNTVKAFAAHTYS